MIFWIITVLIGIVLGSVMASAGYSFLTTILVASVVGFLFGAAWNLVGHLINQNKHD